MRLINLLAYDLGVGKVWVWVWVWVWVRMFVVVGLKAYGGLWLRFKVL